MRSFEIIDGSSRCRKPCATLFYDAKNNRLETKICDWAGENDLPMTLGVLSARGETTVGDKWTRRWIEERVVPIGRQNLGQVLKANDMEFYDAFELFVKAEGRCAQDDFYIREVSESSEVGDDRCSFPSEIARCLKEARLEAGVTQMELSHRSGLKQSAISRIESGKANPTAELIEAYASALGKRVELRLA